MPDPFITSLRDWQVFYEVLGESSATLTGLMFVSVSLAARLMTPKTIPFVRTFISPVLGHFLMAFVLSAMMCFPNQTRLSLEGEFGAVGLIGLWRSVLLLRMMARHGRNLRLERQQWLWHFALPAVGSLCLPIGAAGLWRHWAIALDFLAVAVLLLVVTGVVNAWEIALRSFQGTPEDIEDIVTDDFEN